MNILDEYISLTNEGNWEKALPLIEEIISGNPGIRTSWFNYGVCLDALGRHRDAGNAFMRAYEIDPTDYGTQFRVFRSLSLAKDEIGFAKFLESELKKAPEILELISEDSDFEDIVSTKSVQEVIEDFESSE